MQSQLEETPAMFLHRAYSTHGRMALSFISEQKSAEEGAGSIHTNFSNSYAEATFQLEGLILSYSHFYTSDWASAIHH